MFVATPPPVIPHCWRPTVLAVLPSGQEPVWPFLATLGSHQPIDCTGRRATARHDNGYVAHISGLSILVVVGNVLHSFCTTMLTALYKAVRCMNHPTLNSSYSCLFPILQPFIYRHWRLCDLWPALLPTYILRQLLLGAIRVTWSVRTYCTYAFIRLYPWACISTPLSIRFKSLLMEFFMLWPNILFCNSGTLQ